MNGYRIPPGPPFRDQSYAYWRGAFSPEDIQKIIHLGESLPMQPATVFNHVDHELCESIRRTDVSWIAHTPESDWLYKALGHYTADLNSKYFGFQLSEFVDHLQYTVYHGSPDAPGKYDWHMDMDVKTGAPRKLSLVVQLSDPAEYEGGELQFQGISTQQVDKTPGHVHAFPSWLLHRVTPVTKGIRRSLVAWVAGPHFT